MSNNERARLRTLLNYWIEHNKEHSQQFSEWAGKAKTFGEPEASEEILQAVREMNKASESLFRALERLKKKED